MDRPAPGRRPAAPPPPNAADTLLDGVITGAIGAVLVAAWFFALDLARGRPLFTPALLGTLFLHGAGAAQAGPVIAPLEVVSYTVVHLLAFVVLGLLFSWLTGLFDRFPIAGFVLLVVFLCLQLGAVVVTAVVGGWLTRELPAWNIVVANLLAAAGMMGYLWRRHPGAMTRADELWNHDTAGLSAAEEGLERR
jgi:hypothetical protein